MLCPRGLSPPYFISPNPNPNPNPSHTSRHHVAFLTKCKKEKLTPKGLRLHLTVNVVGTDHRELDDEIDRILKTAESEILQCIANYYSKQADSYHQKANSIKQQMEVKARTLPEEEKA